MLEDIIRQRIYTILSNINTQNTEDVYTKTNEQYSKTFSELIKLIPEDKIDLLSELEYLSLDITELEMSYIYKAALKDAKKIEELIS